MMKHGMMTFGLMLRKYLLVHVREKYNLKSYIDSIFLLTAGIFNPSISPLCLKCKTEGGTLTHCLWSCDRLQRYWFLVLGKMENILLCSWILTQSHCYWVYLINASFHLLTRNCLIFSPLLSEKIFYLIGLVINLHHLKVGIRSFLSWFPWSILPMYYIKKQSISGLNGTSSSPYYITRNIVIVLFSGHLTFLLYFSFFPLIC